MAMEKWKTIDWEGIACWSFGLLFIVLSGYIPRGTFNFFIIGLILLAFGCYYFYQRGQNKGISVNLFVIMWLIVAILFWFA